MKTTKILLLTALLLTALPCCLETEKNSDVLFQTSTINALLEGVYDGNVTFAELKKHGDFGIGTFNALDGEMIGLGGDFYQIKSGGGAYPVGDNAKTPFSVVTFFSADERITLDEIVNYSMLEKSLDSRFPSKNIFYAIKIEGNFSHIKTRSVPKQDKPYPKLAVAVENQKIFEFNNVEGTIVGFYTPGYVQGINVPGYHFHFITKDRSAGGHLLECEMRNLAAEIDYTTDFYLMLPQDGEFYDTDLTAGEKEKELEKVEK